MAEHIKRTDQFKSKRDFVPGVAVYDMKRSGDLAWFTKRLIEVNYRGLSVEFLDLPDKVQEEVDAGRLQIKHVPGRLLVPANKGDLTPQVDQFNAKVVRPDTGLTGFEEGRIDIGKVITVELRGRLRFFRQMGRMLVPVSSGDVDRRFTFFTLADLPGVLEVGFSGLKVVNHQSSTAEEAEVAETILGRKLAVELSKDASSRLRALEALREGVRRPLQGGAVESGGSKSSRRRH